MKRDQSPVCSDEESMDWEETQKRLETILGKANLKPDRYQLLWGKRFEMFDRCQEGEEDGVLETVEQFVTGKPFMMALAQQAYPIQSALNSVFEDVMQTT